MDCNIIILINGKKVVLNYESSAPSTNIEEADLYSALVNNKDLVYKQLIPLLKEKKSEIKKRTITVSNIEKVGLDGLQGNYSLAELRGMSQYSDIDFPEENVNIFLVDELKLEGKTIQLRIVQNNGEELFILKNNKYDLQSLARFLKIRKEIRDYGLNIDKSSEYYKPLNKIRKNKGFDNFEDLIIDYLLNKKNYRNTSTDGVSNILILEKFVRNLRNWNLIKEFDDPFSTELNYRKRTLGDFKILITYNDLYQALKLKHPKELEDANIRGYRQLQESGKSKDYLERLLVPDFGYGYLKETENGIILKSKAIPIETKYGITLDTINTLKVSKYLGYNVYKDNDKFYISRGTLLSSAFGTRYDSLEDAHNAIAERIEAQPIISNSAIEFKYRPVEIIDGKKVYQSFVNEKIISKTSYQPGQIIESIDIPVDVKTDIRGGEDLFVTNPNFNMLTFREYIKEVGIQKKYRENILLKINTPEKVALFIYKMNEELGTSNRNGKSMDTIANKIDKAKTKKYYIESREFDEKYKYNKNIVYQVIPVPDDSVKELTKKKSTPMITWMTTISDVLKSLFNVDVELINASEIESLNKEIGGNLFDPNIDKAFIYNGKVYVNSTIARPSDLLHEHVHLILGMIKSNPDLGNNYENLLNLVINTNEGRRMYKKIKESYPGISEMDLREEVFANLFSNYIRGNVNLETKEVFDTNDKTLKNITETIFDTKIENINSFYGSKLTVIFNKFNKEVAKLMSRKDLDFGSTQLSRRISNYINQLISEYNKDLKNGIREDC